jgi:ribonuclease D
MTEPNYKELAEELYKALKEVYRYVPADRQFLYVNILLRKYKEATTRGTGRTTILYHKAITEALENSGKSVEFVDHYPHTQESAKDHTINLRNIIKKLGYAIDVNLIGTEIFLHNRFR